MLAASAVEQAGQPLELGMVAEHRAVVAPARLPQSRITPVRWNELAARDTDEGAIAAPRQDAEAHIWPFAILGFPFSLLGGAVQLPADIYYPVVGVVLVLSAAQMARTALRRSGVSADLPTDPPFIPALATGAIIGFISGTTGTGGGVFLAPVILAMNWGTARQTAATTAVYNLMNSAAALLGAYAWWDQIPSALPGWLIAVAVGGSLGAFIGSRYLPELWLRIILAVILFASGVRLLFG